MSHAAPAFAFAGVPRVNLMPPAETERRRRSSLTRGWAWGVVAAMAASLLIVAGAFALKVVADRTLVAEQSDTSLLLIELGSLSEVSGALATEAELTDFRAVAMGSDFSWSPVIATVTGALPPSVRLVGLHVVTGGIPQGGDPTAGEGLVGTLALESPTAIDLPTTVRQLRTLDGIATVDGRSISAGQQSIGTYAYELDIVFDQSIYSGQFTAEGTE